jgi:GTPase
MKPKLIDTAEFTAEAGNGGNGAISFAHLPGKVKGGPDGGDGGDGGSIKLTVEVQMGTLRHLSGKDRFKAKDGKPGWKAKRRGWDMEDLTIKVPKGTVVWVKTDRCQLLEGRPFYGEDAPQAQHYGLSADPKPYTGFEERWGVQGEQWTVDSGQTYIQVADMNEEGETLTLARGGRGGLGNARFAHSRLTTPRLAQAGEKAEWFMVRLELKVLADVGLVGLPNVGKSSLLAVLTAAHPQIANYPFTTLSPNLGVMLGPHPRGGSSFHPGGGIVIADIPGLIEDAHAGKGLGISFLRHIERCKILVYVIATVDGELGTVNGKNLWQQYQTVRGEVESYGRGLAEKPFLIVINKLDLYPDKMKIIKNTFQKKGLTILGASALSGEGLDEFKVQLAELAEASNS